MVKCQLINNKVEPPPKIRRGESSRFIKGMGKVGDQVKILLNEYQLLFDFNKGEDQ